MNVAIYDSSSDNRSRLSDIITIAFLLQDTDVNVYQYKEPANLLKDASDCKKLDLVIFSQTATQRENDSITALIGEKVECIRLFKPYTIKDAINQIKSVVLTKSDSKCIITNNRRIEVLDTKDILYVESNNNKCVIHCKDGKLFVQYKQLDDMEKEISTPNFLRCHQSFLVNMDYIVSADKSFVLVNGEEVLIRQRETAAIKQKFMEYYHKRLIES